MRSADQRAAERLRLALDLFTTGEAMMRETLRRRHPRASEAELDALLCTWRLDRPGAVDGDGCGTRVPWPRRS